MAGSGDEAILRRIADGLPVGVWVATVPAGDLVYANQTFTEIMGMAARDDVAAGEYAAPYGIRTRDGALYPEERMPFVRAVEERDTVVVDDIVIHRADGRRVAIRAQARPLFAADGAMSHVAIAFIDITREAEEEELRRETEQRLARALRVESIGQLAGGVAHDFNNLLVAIQVIASSMQARATPAQIADLRRIEAVTDSAGELTRSLLEYAGRRSGATGRVSLAAVVEGVAGLLRRTLDRRILVDVDLSDTRSVVGDRAQLEQVVMNLVINARDAMAEGGELFIRTRDQADRVVLEVSDTGHGIEPALRERIFEPYFTTKTSGPVRGTGLGLATVFGIVSAMGGAVTALDRAPRGTTMRVSLPAVVAEAAPAPRTVRGAPQANTGGETILLVEDDPLVRGVLARALGDLGYRVLQAGDGHEAIELFGRCHSEVDAVVLDGIEPRLGGRDAFQAMVAVDPAVRGLVTSGCLGDDEVAQLMALGVRRFLPKPYDIRRLAEAIGLVLSADG